MTAISLKEPLADADKILRWPGAYRRHVRLVIVSTAVRTCARAGRVGGAYSAGGGLREKNLGGSPVEDQSAAVHGH